MVDPANNLTQQMILEPASEAPPADVSVKPDGNPHAALAVKLGIEHLDSLDGLDASATFVERIPIGYARQHQIIGLAGEGKPLRIAFASFDAWDCLDVVGRLLRRPVMPIFAPRQQILAAINRAYQQRTGQADAFIEQMDHNEVLAELQQATAAGGNNEDLLDVASRAPVIKLVNLMLFEAVKLFASDVHVQPYEDQLVVRLRIDGVLFDAFTLPRAILEEVVSRIKVMGKMNIAEKRLPQDGRTTVQVGDRLIDLRLSCVPTSHGERIVIRLLDKSARLYTLEDLGMPEQTLEQFRQLISVEHGLVLVTGPTGGGKSTTLYAALQQLKSKESNILTLEDPIEYQLEGISQIQVATRKGMTFASGLRSVLRQDPDIIMVGEIRDGETATLAIQAALTGHLVFSTLHTNDAASAVTRLLDLGTEPYLVASSVVGVMAQRLVRRICEKCAVPLEPQQADAQFRRLKLDPADVHTHTMRQGTGCNACRQTGYRGRVGLFELLVVDDAVRKQIQQQGSAADVKQAAMAAGLHSLREDGIAKMLAGQTTADEVIRVTARATR